MDAGVGIPESSLDFTFGFDDAKYSDRTLLLEIVDNAQSYDSVPSVKHRRLNDLLTTATTAPRVKTKTIHINSLILAARSPFFRKLFSNGMRESEQKHVTLRMQILEEVSFIELLKYVYSNTLPTNVDALLGLLLIADKFEVDSCLRDSTRALQNLPMSCESALLYLDLPQSLLMSPTVEPLIDAAKQFLVENFKDLDKCKEEVLNLPLLGIQAVLSSDDLQVTSECEVYNFVLTWARKQYPDLEERRGILKTHLLHLVRFPFMTTTKLTEEVQICSDIDPVVASKIVIRALGFKAETPHRKRCLAAEEGNAASRQFVERAYKHRPIKVLEFALAHHQQCIVYAEVMHPVVKNLRSETLHFGGLTLTLALLNTVTRHHGPIFCVALKGEGSAACTFDFEIALRRKPSEEYKRCEKRSLTLCRALSARKYPYKWIENIDKDSCYLINGLLYVRLVLTLKN